MAAHREVVGLRREQVSLPEGHPLRRQPLVAWSIGALGLVLSVALGTGDPRQFYFSWLFALVFVLSLSLGALYFVLIHSAMQAGWGVAVRRVAETVAVAVPLLAVLFVPVLVGMKTLYPWTADAADAAIRGKAPYLNVPFFLARAAIYFVVWSGIAVTFYRSSRRQDESGDPEITRRLRTLSNPSILLLALTQTFAAVDWIMSLTPHWYSTIFGVYYFAGSYVAFGALLTLLVTGLRRFGPLAEAVSAEHMHDLGKFVFAFVCFWAYIAFSQYFLIWYGNIPEETSWYKTRLTGSWTLASGLLALGHFAIPFLLLMGRAIKRRRGALAAAAAWVLLMHLLDVYWMVLPTLHPDGIRFRLLDLTALAAVWGLFAGTVGWLLGRAPLVPIGDPRLPESLAFENA